MTKEKGIFFDDADCHHITRSKRYDVPPGLNDEELTASFPRSIKLLDHLLRPELRPWACHERGGGRLSCPGLEKKCSDTEETESMDVAEEFASTCSGDYNTPEQEEWFNLFIAENRKVESLPDGSLGRGDVHDLLFEENREEWLETLDQQLSFADLADTLNAQTDELMSQRDKNRDGRIACDEYFGWRSQLIQDGVELGIFGLCGGACIVCFLGYVRERQQGKGKRRGRCGSGGSESGGYIGDESRYKV